MKTTEKLELKVKIGEKTIKFDETKAKKFIKLGVKAEKYQSVLKDLEVLSKRENLSVDEFVRLIKAEKEGALKRFAL